MNEIEKLYENAGTCKIKNKKCTAVEYLDCENWHCTSCNKYVTEYPPFTAEKQLELIKWLCKNTYRNYIHFRYERDINNWKMECNMVGLREYGSFEECFAGLINALWQSLTEEEKEQIRGILNGN